MNRLKDQFDRHIEYLRISITDRCNLRCVYCDPERKERHFSDDELLTRAEIVRFVRAAYKRGLKMVRLTGGEPLMRNDLLDIVRDIKDIGVPDLSLTSNGILLAAMAQKLKDAGLKRVNISLDTLNAEKYATMTGGGNIRRVWEAIEEAQRCGLNPVKINVVPIRGTNDDEVVDFAALTLEKNFHVRFIEYMPIGRASICLKGACVKKDELMKKISALGELELSEFKGHGPSRNYKIKGAKGVIGFISPVSEHFCSQCNRLRLTANGKIRPCLLSKISIDVLTSMRKGITDEGLQGLLHEAISVKPERHTLDKDGTLSDLSAMSKIGG